MECDFEIIGRNDEVITRILLNKSYQTMIKISFISKNLDKLSMLLSMLPSVTQFRYRDIRTAKQSGIETMVASIPKRLTHYAAILGVTHPH